MKKRLTRIAPLHAGIVLSILSLFFGLLYASLALLLSGVMERQTDQHAGAMIMFGILLPFGSAIAGFVWGTLLAAIYNFIARWTGGLEFEATDISS